MAYDDLHVHSEYSVMDGLSTTAEIAARIAANGGTAGALTDHGGCFGHVQWQRDADAAGIKPIFGIETYFQPDRLIRPPGTEELRARRDAAESVIDNRGSSPSDAAFARRELASVSAELEKVKDQRASLTSGRHLILMAQTDKGLHDLWAASTEAFTTGFYGKPRMDWDLLEEYGSELVCTTACLGGIISRDVAAMDADTVIAKLDRLKSIFKGRLYLEVQGNELPEQRHLNKMLAAIGESMGIPLVATCDAHYPSPEQADLHRQWMLCQTGGGKDDYWHFSSMLPEQDVRASLAYLDPAVVDAAIRNTTEISASCNARIGGHAEPPVFTPGGTADDDARALRQMCDANWGLVEHLGPEYRDRDEREFGVVAGKHLAGCYLIVEDLIRYARTQLGVLVGPGRGSAAGSLISYVLGITSVDPLPAGLLFERFLTLGREALPDFDLDFPTSARGPIQDYAVDRYGADHVVRVGTIMRYGTKGILKKLLAVTVGTDDSQADAALIGKLVDQAEAGTAGLGLPWDEIMEDPEIGAFREKYPQVFATAATLYGRVYAQGQHPAGLIISPGKSLAGEMPMRHASTSDRLLVSQWDYRAAEDLGLLKLDILTLRTLDTISRAIDLVERRTGFRLDPRSWDAEHFDPQVYDLIDTGLTAGMFQVETSLCREYAKRQKPRRLGHLADLTTFIRPGPRNSGATEKYLNRFLGLEEVSYDHPLLEELLRDTYGVMLYQEQVMQACMILAGYSELEADGVRKILGKKQLAKVESAGQEFTRRAVGNGHDEAVMTALWADMAEFGKYAFNKAHGFSYGVLSYWTAWLKAHYPAEFLTAVMSTVDMDRLPEFAMEARRIGLTVLPPDARYSAGDFTVDGITVRYGLSAIPKVGPAAVKKIVAGQPYATYEDFTARSGANAGVVYALAKAGALDELVSSRKGLVRTLEMDRDGESVRCVHKSDDPLVGGDLPCAFDWDADAAAQAAVHETAMAPRVAAGRKPLKLTVKGPPKRCTRACRCYTPPQQKGMAAWGEYPPDALFRQDLETYGTWMSDAVFARLDSVGSGVREQARDIARMLVTAGAGSYPVAAVFAGSRMATTKRGSAMWWVKLVTEVSVLDLACFSPLREGEPDVPAMLRRIHPGTLVEGEVVKRAYMSKGGLRMGWRLAAVYPVAE